MLKRINADTFVGLGFSAFALLAYRFMLDIPKRDDLGPAFFPQIIIGLMFVLGLVLAVKSLFQEGAAPITINKGALIKIVALALLSYLYAVGFPIVGFVPATMAVFGITLWLFGVRNKKLLAALVIIVPVGVYLVFSKLLHVPL